MNKKEIKRIKSILELNGIDLNKKDIEINNKVYKRNELFANASNFSCFSKNAIILNKANFIKRVDIIYDLFILNAFKFTFFGQILPMFVFLGFSLITKSIALFFQNKANLGFEILNEVQIYFLDFLSILCFLFFAIFLYFWIKKEKIIYTKKENQNRFSHLKYSEYLLMCETFKENIQNKPIFFENIETERTIIREFKENDVFDVYEYASNPNVTRYLLIDTMKKLDDAKKYIQDELKNYENKFVRRLAIYEKEAKKVIGYIGLSNRGLSLKNCEVVYALNETFWHKGYVKEALLAFIKYLKECKKEYIIGGHVQENENSGKILISCGFIRTSDKDYDMIFDNQKYHILAYGLDLNKGDEGNEENKPV